MLIFFSSEEGDRKLKANKDSSKARNKKPSKIGFFIVESFFLVAVVVVWLLSAVVAAVVVATVVVVVVHPFVPQMMNSIKALMEAEKLHLLEPIL